MANKNIQIKNRNVGTWDNLYPKTLSSLVDMGGGETLEQFANNIIETGSDLNGYYIKFKDGTLICYSSGSNGVTTLTKGDFIETSITDIFMYNVQLTFPINFVGSVTINGYVSRASGGAIDNIYWCGTSGGARNSGQITVFKIRNMVATGELRYIAIGRWK